MLLHHPDQGPVEPEIRRPRPPVRRRQRRAAHRRQQHQRRGAGGGDDHRGPAQHALRRLGHPVRPELRGPGRGALPGRRVPRRGLGRSNHPSARVGPGGGPVGHGQQRRGVRRLADPGPGRDHRDRGRAPAGAALAARAGRRAALRPVRGAGRGPARGPGSAGQPGTAAAGPAGGVGGPSRSPAYPVPAAAPAGGDRAAGRGRPAARDHLHLQPGRLRRGGPAVPGRGPAADHAGRSGGHHPDRGTADGGGSRVGPPGARLRRVAHRPAARYRCPPRGHAADLQGSGGGAVRGRAGAGGLRDRDAGPRDQHARPHGRHRAA